MKEKKKRFRKKELTTRDYSHGQSKENKYLTEKSIKRKWLTEKYLLTRKQLLTLQRLCDTIYLVF